MKKTVAVDVDGVILEYDGWNGLHHLGDPIPGARNFLTALQENFEVLIHTTRINSRVNKIDYLTPEQSIGYQVRLLEEHFEEHDLPYDRIWAGRGKPLAIAIIDDRAFRACPAEADRPRHTFNTILEDLDIQEGVGVYA